MFGTGQSLNIGDLEVHLHSELPPTRPHLHKQAKFPNIATPYWLSIQTQETMRTKGIQTTTSLLMVAVKTYTTAL